MKKGMEVEFAISANGPNKVLHRSWLAFRLFNVVSFVYVFWFFNAHSRWSASPVNLVVGAAQLRAICTDVQFVL